MRQQFGKISDFLHELFEVGVALKAINGAWEVTSGIIFLFFNRALDRLIFFIIRGELLEDPRDIIINFLTNVPNNARKFAGVYILIHGILNLFLAYQLFKERLWAYLITIWATIIFIAYQIYRIRLYHSRVLMVLTIVDVIFTWLTYREYRRQQALRSEQVRI